MGSSSKQVVGYKYYLGLHFAICYGPVDKLRRILCGEREAWSGSVTANETIEIDAPSLFGGKKREGGIEGDLDVMMGGPAQTANAYLSGQIDGLMPAFRGILSCVYNGGYISANNPYVKPWAFEVERILESWHDETWYPEKAPIPFATTGPGITEVLYEDLVMDATEHSGPPSDLPGFPARFLLIDNLQPEDVITISVPGGLTYDAISRWPDSSHNGGLVWSNGVHITNDQDETVEYLDVEAPASEYPPPYYYATQAEAIAYASSQEPIQVTGSTFYKLHAADWITGLNRDGVSMRVLKTSGTANAMNPAHIVYQCLTDPLWGMGYPVAQIDDASFTAAADTFFAEGLGLCLIWNQQSSIDDFVQLVLDHAGAVLFADPKTGKFKLKALRADYDVDYLDVYDESNIISLDNFQRPGYGETINEITVVYRDFSTSKDSSITVQDLANIQAQGGVVSQTRQYPGLPTSELAARIAERDVIAASTPLAKCRITVNRSGWEETPGNVIKVNWDKLGLESVIFRVLTINYGALTDGQLVIELAEDVYGLPATSYSEQEPTGFTEPVITPTQLTVQDVLETPYWDIARTLTAADLSFLDADAAYIMAVASTTNPVSLGFEMYSRVSPADYVNSDSSGTFAPTVVLAGSVGLTRADTVIEYGSGVNIEDVAVGQRALIGTGRDAEFVEIVDIDEMAAEIEVNRGILDTTPQEHAIGARIFFNETDFAVDPTERATGDSVDVKLSVYSGGGETPIAGATAMNIEPDQRLYRPYPPGKIRINGDAHPDEIFDDITITWAHRDRLQQLVNYVDQDENSIGPEAGTTYTVRIYLDGSLVYTESAISGTTSTLYTFITPIPPGTLGRAEIESVRDGITSWQMQVREFIVTTAQTDAYFANVVALLHFNGADGSTTFTDQKAHTFTAAGNAQLDTAQFKFATASGLFDGTGDYISTPDSADWDFGTGDFTVEAFIRFNALPVSGVACLVSNYQNTTTGWYFQFRNDFAVARLNFGSSGDTPVVDAAWSPSTGVWYHVAVSRSGSSVRFFVNGTQIGSTGTNSENISGSTGALHVGTLNSAIAQYFNGWMDELRITKGVARYTANFTAPASPFPDS